jgi:hypothetical protein
VPACEADAQRVDRGEEPQSRHVLAGGAWTPYWAAPPVFGGYFGGFLPGLLLGELLSGGWGFGPGPGYYDVGGNGFDGGGGDFGGDGDFGGGGDF